MQIGKPWGLAPFEDLFCGMSQAGSCSSDKTSPKEFGEQDVFLSEGWLILSLTLFTKLPSRHLQSTTQVPQAVRALSTDCVHRG